MLRRIYDTDFESVVKNTFQAYYQEFKVFEKAALETQKYTNIILNQVFDQIKKELEEKDCREKEIERWKSIGMSVTENPRYRHIRDKIIDMETMMMIDYFSSEGNALRNGINVNFELAGKNAGDFLEAHRKRRKYKEEKPEEQKAQTKSRVDDFKENWNMEDEKPKTRRRKWGRS